MATNAANPLNMWRAILQAFGHTIATIADNMAMKLENATRLLVLTKRLRLSSKNGGLITLNATAVMMLLGITSANIALRLMNHAAKLRKPCTPSPAMSIFAAICNL